MDSNIFSQLDEDLEVVPQTIQQKVRETEKIKGNEEKDKSTLRSKAIVGKKNKGKKMGKEMQFKFEAKIEKKKKKQSLKAKSKSIY